MTQPNLDAERPRETVPCGCPADGECANECTACQYAADNAWDCDHQGAAVHQVAKGPLTNWCKYDDHGRCQRSIELAESRGDTLNDCACPCHAFAPAEVHQTLEPQGEHLYPHQKCGGCGEMFETTNQRLLHHCKPVDSPPPDQHVAPPKLWMSADLITNSKFAESFDVPPEMRSLCVEYLAATPIRAALEACEREALHPDGRISFRRPDYEALVVAIK